MPRADLDLDELAGDLAEFAPPERSAGRSAREERVIAGFEEIQAFVDAQGRAPAHGETRDIFERIHAVRLDRIRASDECRAILSPLDRQGLLGSDVPAARENSGVDGAAIDDLDALAAELEEGLGVGDLTDLRHVRASADKQAAEEVANRQPCADFERFRPLFEAVQRELAEGVRETRPFELKAEIVEGAWFIVCGQKAYVAAMDETHTTAHGRTDARLRVIFENGTESDLLLRSLQRALNKDEAGRRITDPVAGPLFAGQPAETDEASGTIDVLRSKSGHPMVAANREVVHKIGVTSMPVEQRIAGARLQPTFLMADVEVVASYTLYNINRTRLERLIHRVFAPARLDIEVRDRFGRPVTPEEWFLVPLSVIDQAVDRIRDGSIVEHVYDPAEARLVRVETHA